MTFRCVMNTLRWITNPPHLDSVDCRGGRRWKRLNEGKVIHLLMVLKKVDNGNFYDFISIFFSISLFLDFDLFSRNMSVDDILLLEQVLKNVDTIVPLF